MSANVLTGSLTASGNDGKTFSASKGVLGTKFNLTISGTFVGTVALQRSFDSGTTWFPLTRAGAAVTFTAPCSEVFDEPEDGVLYRVNFTFTSGTMNYRLSQ